MLSRLILASVLLCQICVLTAHAQSTYTAASCSYADVNACVNSGAAATCSPGGTHTVINGDTVNIPAGTCTWTSTLVGPANVGFTLTGAGTPNSGSGTTGAATPTTSIIHNINNHLMTFTPAYGA